MKVFRVQFFASTGVVAGHRWACTMRGARELRRDWLAGCEGEPIMPTIETVRITCNRDGVVEALNQLATETQGTDS